MDQGPRSQWESLCQLLERIQSWVIFWMCLSSLWVIILETSYGDWICSELGPNPKSHHKLPPASHGLLDIRDSELTIC